jgi:DNA-directed RNA polymerase specialized sigma24 family protein
VGAFRPTGANSVGSIHSIRKACGGVRSISFPINSTTKDWSTLPKAAKPKTKALTLAGPQDELVALAVLLLRRDASSQSELAREMHSAGFSSSRIAELLGTTANTINQAIQKGKKAKTKGVKSSG